MQNQQQNYSPYPLDGGKLSGQLTTAYQGNQSQAKPSGFTGLGGVNIPVSDPRQGRRTRPYRPEIENFGQQIGLMLEGMRSGNGQSPQAYPLYTNQIAGKLTTAYSGNTANRNTTQHDASVSGMNIPVNDPRSVSQSPVPIDIVLGRQGGVPPQRQAGGPIAPSARRQPQVAVDNPVAMENVVNQAGIESAADQYISEMDQFNQRLNSMPQHLRFTDPQARRMVNSGTGIQLDYGNLPSSQTQLDFANRAEQRALRGDKLLQTVMNPVTYNGIRVNNQAIANNLSMSEGQRQELASSGFEVSPEGVVRRAPRNQTGGGTFGMPNPQAAQTEMTPEGADAMRNFQAYSQRMQDSTDQDMPVTDGSEYSLRDNYNLSLDEAAEATAGMTGIPEGSVIDPTNVARGRLRYGMSPDGTSRAPSGRVANIMARTDLNDSQKADFIAKADAQSARLGRIPAASLVGQAQNIYNDEEDQRARRVGGMQQRQAYFEGIRQRQAQAAMQQQQAQTMGMIAQQAMMGNPQAMQILGNMQLSAGDAARIAMDQQRLAADQMNAIADIGLRRDIADKEAGIRNQELGLRQQELGFNKGLAAITEENRAAELARKDAYDTKMLDLEDKKATELIRAANAKSQNEASEANLRIEKLEQEIRAARMQNDLAQRDYDKQVRGDDIFGRSPSETAAALVQSGSASPDEALDASNRQQSIERLMEIAQSDPAAKNVLSIGEPDPKAVSQGGYQQVEDFFRRANQSGRFIKDTYGAGFFGGGTPVAPTGPKPSPEVLQLKMESEGIGMPQMLEYENAVKQEVLNDWSRRRVTDRTRANVEKLNYIRSMMGKPLIDLNTIRYDSPEWS